MQPNEFIKKIYYGDSGCKKIIIDGWSRCVKFQLDSIFIMKGGVFNYLVDDEITDVFITFEDVSDFIWSGRFLPNDVINQISCNSEHANEQGEYCFTVSINHVDSESHSHETVLFITARNVSLEKNQEII